MREVQMRAVAVVRSQRTENIDDNWGGVISEVVFHPDLDAPESIAGLEQFSHVEIVFYFDRVDPMKSIPPSNHPRDRKDLPRNGIFAQRRSLRPNRIGTTVCRLISVLRDRIVVEGLDAIDGSPVLDVKPYIRDFAPRGKVFQPQWATDIMSSYFARSMKRNEYPAHWPTLQTERLSIRLQAEFRPEEIYGYTLRNREYFSKTNPSLPDSFMTLEHFQRQNVAVESQFDQGTGVALTIAKKTNMQIPIGTVIFSDVIRGPLQSARLGYTLDEKEQGHGYMTEALVAAINYIFDKQKIHRIAACYVVGNIRSAQVLQRLKFTEEGVSPSFMFVNGEWRDHVQTSKINSKILEAYF